MEMNTRVQVEHPVTEMVTGVDIVKEPDPGRCGTDTLLYPGADNRAGPQHRMPDVKRVPGKFTPSPAPLPSITAWRTGSVSTRRLHPVCHPTVLRFHDRQAHRLCDTREEAIMRMKRALDEFIIEGVKTTIPMHKKILSDADFHKEIFPPSSWSATIVRRSDIRGFVSSWTRTF